MSTDKCKHALDPDSVPVRRPAEECFIYLLGGDGIPYTSPSSCLNPRSFEFPATGLLSCLLPYQVLAFATPAIPSSGRRRKATVPQRVLWEQREYTKAQVLQNAAEVGRGDVRYSRRRWNRYFRDHVMPVEPHEVER